MKIPSVSLYSKCSQSKKECNKPIENNIVSNRADSFSSRPSFGVLVDGVDYDTLSYSENSFIKHLDTALDWRRINKNQKEVILKALALAKDEINELTKPDHPGYYEPYIAEIRVVPVPVITVPQFLLCDPPALWSNFEVQFGVRAGKAFMGMRTPTLNLKKESKRKDQDEAAKDMAKQMVEYTKESIVRLDEEYEEYAKKYLANPNFDEDEFDYDDFD